ncbi:MAG: hypothetical protein KF861_21135, partial [Planctomycetaceae bacterium]|nr:hypothetical protein [Planctomycetaceae bacterium]
LGGSPKTDPEAVADFRNNVIYNLTGATNLGNCRINVINNVYRPGPDTPASGKPLATKIENPHALKVFLDGNRFEGRPDLESDPSLAINFDRWTTRNYLATHWDEIAVATPFDVGAATPLTESAEAAYQRVLTYAGASLRRDAADARLIQGVQDRSNRLIDSQAEVGGWPVLESEPAPRDTDRDGMPDAWERQHGLDPHNPDDRNGLSGDDGYTHLEQYLNSLCPSETATLPGR